MKRLTRISKIGDLRSTNFRKFKFLYDPELNFLTSLLPSPPILELRDIFARFIIHFGGAEIRSIFIGVLDSLIYTLSADPYFHPQKYPHTSSQIRTFFSSRLTFKISVSKYVLFS